MKDYKISEIKEICSKQEYCFNCPLFELCSQMNNGVAIYNLEIDIDEEDVTNMEDRKKIEEMAKDYYGYSIDLEEDCKFVAEEMYDKGHRKLSQDSVVLTREEYEKIIHERDEYLNDRFAVCHALRQARKETAREIFSKLLSKDMIDREEWSEDNYTCVYETVDADDIRELAKQYGVEE